MSFDILIAKIMDKKRYDGFEPSYRLVLVELLFDDNPCAL